MSWPSYLPIHSYANIQVEVELKISEILIGLILVAAAPLPG